MSNRDDFTESTKLQLAKRAGFECSFPECKIVTVGPSDESDTAVASIGKAAHICGAASGPGSRRYDRNMTPEQRSSIDNGIWLCSIHADLIDRDEARFTLEVLRGYKALHEEYRKTQLGVPRDEAAVRERAYQDWVVRVRDVIKWTKHAHRREEPSGALIVEPVFMMLANNERAWATRAVVEGHLVWAPSADAVMLPGDSATFYPKHAFDPLKFIVLNAGAHMNRRLQGFPAHEVLQSLRSSVAAIRVAGLDAAATAIARKESPPPAVLDAIEKRSLERTASRSERARAIEALRAGLLVREQVRQALIAEWACDGQSTIAPAFDQPGPVLGLLTDAIAAVDDFFDATRTRGAASTVVLRDALVAMRFHMSGRPREIGDDRAMRWRDFAIENRALAEQIADDIRRLVDG